MPSVALGLGAPAEVTRRIVNAWDELADPATGRVRMPLGEVGVAVTAPLGTDVFDEDDATDRALLVELLRVLGPALAASGWLMPSGLPSSPPADAMVSAKSTRKAPNVPRTAWCDLPMDVRPLQRWHRRAAGTGPGLPLPEASTQVPTIPTTLAMTPTEGCVGNRTLWLRHSAGCQPAPGGRLRCRRCGSVTVLAEPTITGPRLPLCRCLGDGVAVCAHPMVCASPPEPPPQPTPGQRSAGRRASAGTVNRRRR